MPRENPRQRKDPSRTCYLHQTANKGVVRYDAGEHTICSACAAKLGQLGRAKLDVHARRQRVSIRTQSLVTRRFVSLTTGYDVCLSEEGGLEHLFNAVIGEVLTHLKNSPEVRKRGFALVLDIGVCELHFVAGQLLQQGSSIEPQMLVDEFLVHWEQFVERLSND